MISSTQVLPNFSHISELVKIVLRRFIEEILWRCAIVLWRFYWRFYADKYYYCCQCPLNGKSWTITEVVFQQVSWILAYAIKWPKLCEYRKYCPRDNVSLPAMCSKEAFFVVRQWFVCFLDLRNWVLYQPCTERRKLIEIKHWVLYQPSAEKRKLIKWNHRVPYQPSSEKRKPSNLKYQVLHQPSAERRKPSSIIFFFLLSKKK